MYLIVAFFLGIANFAMHKAVVESGHPFVEDTKLYFGKHMGRNSSYIFEFGILLGAMLLSFWGSGLVLGFYMAYTLFNAIAAWLLLSRRL
ncbi:MAG: hypothetical protein ACRCY3_01660 [Sphingorhabdus sp.]